MIHTLVSGTSRLRLWDRRAIISAGDTFVASMIECDIEERSAGVAALVEDFRAKVTAATGSNLADVTLGSALGEEAKAPSIAHGLWSQYLEFGIGPHPKSDRNNPKPELDLVLAVSSKGRNDGASFGNDVNLRDFEGRSALLLSKAMDNNASYAFGPMVRLFDADFSLDDLMGKTLLLSISGPDVFVLEETCDMAQISRDPRDLVAQTGGGHHRYPDGAMLFLGTPIARTKVRGGVEMGITHHMGDNVRISPPELGTLENTAARASDCTSRTFDSRELMHNPAGRRLL